MSISDPPVGVGCDLSGVVFEALGVLLYGLLMLSFLHQSVAFFFQGMAFLYVFITGSCQEDVKGKTEGKKDEVIRSEVSLYY